MDSWRNLQKNSPLVIQALAQDKTTSEPPMRVLISAPENLAWLGGLGERWVAVRGKGAETALLSYTPAGWKDTGLRGVKWVMPDQAQRLLCVSQGVVWTVSSDNAQPLLHTDVPIDAVSYLDADHIALVTQNRLVFIKDSKIEGSWCLADKEPAGDFCELRALPEGGLLLIEKRSRVKTPPFEEDLVHVLKIIEGIPWRIGCFCAPEEAGEFNHWASVDVEYIGPYDGPYAKGTKGSPLQDMQIAGDAGIFTIEGWEKLSSADSEFLTPCDPPALCFNGLPPVLKATPLASRKPAVPKAPNLNRLGPLSRRLLERMRSNGHRSKPDASVLSLLNLPIPNDLYALLYTWAHYRVSATLFENIDWWIDVKPQVITGLFAGRARHAIQIGTMASGDPYVVQIMDRYSASWKNFDEEGSPYWISSSLESLLLTVTYQTKELDTPTIFDDLLED